MYPETIIEKNITTIILTFNSEQSIYSVAESSQIFSGRILVVDSGSTDRTVEIAKEMGCDVVSHPFENYSVQRNWAQDYAVRHYGMAASDWVVHLDSDEVVSEELGKDIFDVARANLAEVDGFLMQRLSYFMGKPIRHGHINPSWHLRLYRVGKGQCENRLYDQHYIVDGNTKRLDGLLLDLQLTNLERWTAAHNRWSTAEAEEVLREIEGTGDKDGTLPASLSGDSRMKKRWLKNNIWYKLPLLSRPMIFFIYSYFFRLGFLDGREGLIYHLLQAFWFRFLVDAKIVERKQLGVTGMPNVDTMLKVKR